MYELIRRGEIDLERFETISNRVPPNLEETLSLIYDNIVSKLLSDYCSEYWGTRGRPDLIEPAMKFLCECRTVTRSNRICKELNWARKRFCNDCSYILHANGYPRFFHHEDKIPPSRICNKYLILKQTDKGQVVKQKIYKLKGIPYSKYKRLMSDNKNISMDMVEDYTKILTAEKVSESIYAPGKKIKNKSFLKRLSEVPTVENVLYDVDPGRPKPYLMALMTNVESVDKKLLEVNEKVKEKIKVIKSGDLGSKIGLIKKLSGYRRCIEVIGETKAYVKKKRNDLKTKLKEFKIEKAPRFYMQDIRTLNPFDILNEFEDKLEEIESEIRGDIAEVKLTDLEIGKVDFALSLKSSYELHKMKIKNKEKGVKKIVEKNNKSTEKTIKQIQDGSKRKGKGKNEDAVKKIKDANENKVKWLTDIKTYKLKCPLLSRISFLLGVGCKPDTVKIPWVNLDYNLELMKEKFYEFNESECKIFEVVGYTERILEEMSKDPLWIKIYDKNKYKNLRGFSRNFR